MEGNGVAEMLPTLSAHEACLAKLTRLSSLGGAIHGLRGSCGLDLSVPNQAAAPRLAHLASELEGGIGPVLASLPRAGTLQSLTQLSLLSGCISSVRQTFKVDLLQPGAERTLEAELKNLESAGARVPRLPSGDLSRLIGLGASTRSISDGLGIDLRQPGTQQRIGNAFAQMRGCGLFAALRSLPFRPGTIVGLGQFSTLATSVHRVKGGTGIHLIGGGAGAQLASLGRLLHPGGALASILVRIGTGRLAAGGPLRCLDFGRLARMTTLFAGLRMTQQNLGVNLFAPRAGAHLRSLFASLNKHGACRAVDDLPLQPSDMEGVGRLQSVVSGVQTSRDDAGIDLLRKGGADQAARFVDGFHRSAANTALESVTVSPEMLEGLSKLTMLVTVKQGLDSMGE